MPMTAAALNTAFKTFSRADRRRQEPAMTIPSRQAPTTKDRYRARERRARPELSSSWWRADIS